MTTSSENLLETVARMGRVALATDTDVDFVGETDPIYPSPLRLAAATAGVLGLFAASFESIRRRQGRPPQKIRIDLAHAALTISSMWMLRVDGELAILKLPFPFPLEGQGVFPSCDGHQLHLMSGFPHLVDRTLATLGADARSLAETVAGRDADELEAALVAEGMPGVVVRSHDVWLAHPQGRWLDSRPAIEIERIGDGPPIPLPEEDLRGLRVLDSTRVLAGPTCSRTLAAFGADVLQIGTPTIPDLPSAQADTGHGKRRAFLDVGTPEGAARAWDLIAGADVFSQSHRPTSFARRGFGPEAVARRRPGIIYVSESAYGDGGPWREKRGFDANVQAATGIDVLHEPGASGGAVMAVNDYCTGYWGAYGILEALRRRASEGGSWHVRVSLGQTAHWLMRLGAPHDRSEGRSAEELFALAEGFMERVESDYGELTRLRFPIELSDSPARWGRTVRPGTHDASWLPRD